MLYSCFPLAAIASTVFYKAEQNGHNPSLTQSIPVKLQNGTLDQRLQGRSFLSLPSAEEGRILTTPGVTQNLMRSARSLLPRPP